MSEKYTKEFDQHPLLDDIVAISKIKNVEVLEADFESGHIVIKMKNQKLDFNSVLASIRFFDLHDKIAIRKVDFESGEVTVTYHPFGVDKIYMNLNISKEEIDFIKTGRRFDAVRACRLRTGLSIKDAKELVEKAEEELRKRGIIK